MMAASGRKSMPPTITVRPTAPPMATNPAIATTGALAAMATSPTSMVERKGVLRGSARSSTRLPRVSVIARRVIVASAGRVRPGSTRNAVGM